MSEELPLFGRHALVCGASAGIGQAAAMALAVQGAHITVLARRAERLESLLPVLLELGASGADALVADLDDREALAASVSQAIDSRGNIHVLVNNTGGPPGGPLLQASEDVFLSAFSRHVLASHRLVQLVVPGMAADGFGRIVNVISTSVREPIPNLVLSNAMRMGVLGTAKTLSKELARDNILVNVIAPGRIYTERIDELDRVDAEREGTTVEAIRKASVATIPIGRLGQPKELANLAVFLSSEAASYVTGAAIQVDGGMQGTY